MTNDIRKCAHCGNEHIATRQYGSVHFEVVCTNPKCNAKVWSDVSMEDAIMRWNRRCDDD